MFGLSLIELFVVVLSLIVFIKPKDLPFLFYKIGKGYGKIKNMQRRFYS